MRADALCRRAVWGLDTPESPETRSADIRPVFVVDNKKNYCCFLVNGEFDAVGVVFGLLRERRDGESM